MGTCSEWQMHPISWFHREPLNGRNRRVSLLAEGPGGGLISDHIAGVEPHRREPLNLPHSRPRLAPAISRQRIGIRLLQVRSKKLLYPLYRIVVRVGVIFQPMTHKSRAWSYGPQHRSIERVVNAGIHDEAHHRAITIVPGKPYVVTTFRHRLTCFCRRPVVQISY